MRVFYDLILGEDDELQKMKKGSLYIIALTNTLVASALTFMLKVYNREEKQQLLTCLKPHSRAHQHNLCVAESDEHKRPGSIVNAKLRMRRRREALKLAPSEVQQEAVHKARQHRRNYNERARAHREPRQEIVPPLKKNKSPKLTAPKHAAPQYPPEPTTPPRPAISPFNSIVRQTTAYQSFVLCSPPKPATNQACAHTPPTPTPPDKKRQRVTRTPKSLAVIDAESDGKDGSDEGSESDDAPPRYPPESSIHRWWEYIDTDGPLWNRTGHPDYVPERGQQPYFKGGRKYWF
ncbi:hypothetical protein C8F04DRAFT_1270124 [Mycena alexandri]|uniref:Uncharacterized protein n=1 Tax=Mycena alexandri TaxID=1745969 RepID=A0AAD6SBN4_9AGAR|nr:hypothetical protein C8F04DRAFT_1270124 [Mycena alexandri]